MFQLVVIPPPIVMPPPSAIASPSNKFGPQSAVRALRFRPNGAKCDSLGQRPRKDHNAQTPKPQRGETNGIAPRCFAPLGLF